MDRYRPLKTNATSASVMLIDTGVEASQLLENALFRIGTGTGLLEVLTSITFESIKEADFFRLVSSAYMPLQEGLELLEQFHFKHAQK